MSPSTTILLLAGDLNHDRLRVITARKFFKALVPLMIINLIAVFAAFSLYSRFLDIDQQHQISTSIESARSLIHRDMEHIASSLSYIQSSLAIQNYVNKGDEVTRNEVAYALYNLIDTRRIYDQARLIGANGRELVRVNQEAEGPVIIEDDYLQDKSKRYYFQEGSKTPSGTIYMSPMDLNMEYGSVEYPLSPVIRFSRSLHDKQGEFQGMVLLNYHGAEILSKFETLMASIPGEAMLVNKLSFWLYNRDHSLEWGNVLGHNQSFASMHPEIWSEMQQQKSGVLRSGDTTFTYLTINPFSESSSSALQQGSGDESHWTIIVARNDIKVPTLLTESLPHAYPLLIVYPIVLLLIWFWAKASAAQELAEQNLLELNQTLENKVQARTRELQVIKDITVLSMATLAETRDEETGLHIKRTQLFVKRLAQELQKHPKYSSVLDNESVRLIYKSAPLHDIGKVGIPDDILLKPGKLTDDEFEVMKQHPVIGVNAFKESISMMETELPGSQAPEFLLYAKQIINYHHEKWDGSGYPEGLKGEDIPLPARIMMVADVFDAISCQRVYKRAFGKEETFKIMKQSCGTFFDPDIYQVFENIREEFWDIRNRLSDEVTPAKAG